MKQLNIITIIIFSIIGCNLNPSYEAGLNMEFDIPDLELKTVEDVVKWTSSEIKYESDSIHDVDNYLQNPYQTYIWKTGDCEDYIILAMYLIKRDVNKISAMILGYSEIMDHAWLQVEGEDWEPQTGEQVDYSKDYPEQIIIPYEEAIYRSATTHKAVE